MKAALASLAIVAFIGGTWLSGTTGEILSHHGVAHQLFAQDDEHVGSTSEELRSGNPAGGAYGPDTCRQGFVWRDAFPGDHVCVPPTVRAQAARDNAVADARRQPGGGAYGPDTCRQGFVWREASPRDHVCVTPETRAQAASDNRFAAARRISPPR